MLRIENGNVVSGNIVDTNNIYGVLHRLKECRPDGERTLQSYLFDELRCEIVHLRATADFIEKELNAIEGKNK